MKKILYMAVSADGFIARNNNDTSWVSLNEWNNFLNFAKTAGCLIVGRKTYEILTSEEQFTNYNNLELVVVSHNLLKIDHTVAHSPEEALEILKQHETIVIAGGSKLNASFLEKNLIDEIYLDVEPVLLGDGIPLFSSISINKNLTLGGYRVLENNLVQLHYLLANNSI